MEFLLFESRFGRGFASGRSDRNHEYSAIANLAVCFPGGSGESLFDYESLNPS